MINLQELNYKNKIDINGELQYKKEFYQDTDILDLKNIKIIGNITLDEEGNYFVKGNLTCIMMLHDSITFDVIPYEFNVDIEESLEKSLKSLDLYEFLWHYIILEVPIRITNSKLEKIENENFRVISEEEYNKKNNPFSDLSL